MTRARFDKLTALSQVEGKAQSDAPRHFDQREKSFLDPSRSLGMTGRGHVTSRLCVFAGDVVFPISSSFPNFKYLWLEFDSPG